MYDYEDYYKDPSEVDALFEEYSDKLKSMLKNEIVTNAKKYDVNKDEVKTMMMVANGLKEEYEQKLEEFDKEISKRAKELCNVWIEKTFGLNFKINEKVYVVSQDTTKYLTCPMCDTGKIEQTIRGRTFKIECPFCRGCKPHIRTYTYKETKIVTIKLHLRKDATTPMFVPYEDIYGSESDFVYDRQNGNYWVFYDEYGRTLNVDRTVKTKEEAEELIRKLNQQEYDDLKKNYTDLEIQQMLGEKDE